MQGAIPLFRARRLGCENPMPQSVLVALGSRAGGPVHPADVCPAPPARGMASRSAFNLAWHLDARGLANLFSPILDIEPRLFQPIEQKAVWASTASSALSILAVARS